MKTKTPETIKFEEPDRNLIGTINKFFNNEGISPGKLFIVGTRRYLLVYEGILSNGWARHDFGYIVPRRLERGRTLDAFSKIELIVNEIIEAKVLNNNGNKRDFEDLTEKISLAQKLQLLRKWGLISQKTLGKLHKLKNVRNVLAHSWHIKNAVYGKDKTLKNNFPQFQEDIKEIWKKLVNVYNYLKPQNEELKEIIEKMNHLLNNKKNGTKK